MELDLSEAVEAAARAAEMQHGWTGKTAPTFVADVVRAAAPIIERAVRERVAADLGAAFIAGAVRNWAVAIARSDPPPSIGRTGASETGGEASG